MATRIVAGKLGKTVRNKDSQPVAGFRHRKGTCQLLHEDTYSIQFLDEQDELRSRWKSEIEQSAVSRGSTMIIPEVLSSDEVNDLVAYLETLRGEEQ